jgi:hypothetical protein
MLPSRGPSIWLSGRAAWVTAFLQVPALPSAEWLPFGLARRSAGDAIHRFFQGLKYATACQ